MTKLIGLGGRLTSGKDTVSDHLVESGGWVKIGMSDALHKVLLTIDPFVEMPIQTNSGMGTRVVHYHTLFESVGYTDSKKNTEVRRLLQVIGTEVGRKMFGEDVWVDIAAHNAQALMDQGYNVALTGIRFPNEVEAVHKLGGELWWVERPGLELGAPGEHESEALTSDAFDRILSNDGTLEDLYGKIDRIF